MTILRQELNFSYFFHSLKNISSINTIILHVLITSVKLFFGEFALFFVNLRFGRGTGGKAGACSILQLAVRKKSVPLCAIWLEVRGSALASAAGAAGEN